MPESYRLKMAAALIDPPSRQSPIPYYHDLLSQLSDLDVLRLKGATAAFKYVINRHTIMMWKVMFVTFFFIGEWRNFQLGEGLRIVLDFLTNLHLMNSYLILNGLKCINLSVCIWFIFNLASLFFSAEYWIFFGFYSTVNQFLKMCVSIYCDL